MTTEEHRQLDALVADKVMGLAVERDQVTRGWLAPKLPDDPWELFVGPSHERVPAYSTDIAAAWTVVAAMQERLNSVENRNVHSPDTAYRLEYGGEDWTAGFTYSIVADCGCPDPFGASASAPTAPLAICKAALRVVGALDAKLAASSSE